MPVTPDKIEQARQAGFSDEDIARRLAGDKYDQTIAAGYTPADIIARMSSGPAPAQTYAEGRSAEMEQRRAEQRGTAAQAASGVVEGGIRAWENVGQLARAGAETVGLAAPGTTQDYSEKLTLRRYSETGGTGVDEQFADLTEGLILMTPAFQAARTAGMLPKLKELTTAGGALARAGRQGFTAGFLAQGASEGTGQDAATAADVFIQRSMGGMLGATLGMGATAVPAAVQGARNFIARSIQNAEKNTETVRALRNSMDVGGYSLSQRTGNPLFKRLEVQVAATKAQEFLNQQYGKFLIGVNNMSTAFRRAAGGTDRAAVDLAYDVSRAYRKDREQLYSAVNTTYGTRLASAIEKAGQDTAKFPLPVDSLESVTRKWADETGEVWWRLVNPGATKISPELKALDDYMGAIRQRNVVLNTPGPGNRNQIGTAFEGLGIEEMVRIRRGLNTADAAYWAKRNSGAELTRADLNAHKMAGDMRRALDKDIDTFLSQNPADRPAVEALRDFRAANADHTDALESIRRLDEAAGAQIFRFGTPIEAADSLRQIAKMEPRQQQYFVRAMRNSNPDVIPQMQAWLVRDAMQSMTDLTGPAVSGRINPEKFMRAVTDEHGQIMGREIFTPTQAAEISRALDTIRLMRNAPANKGVVVTGVERTPEIQGTLMAIASWSEAFLTRQAIRFGGLGPIEKVLFSPQGIRALETVRTTMSAPTEATSRAMAVLGSMLAAEEETE